jgi:hypothetical protein
MRFFLVAATAAWLALGCEGTSVEVLSSPLEPVEAGVSCGPADAGNVAEGGPVESSAPQPDAGDDGGKGAHGGTWPTFAHDARRTGRAEGAGAMSSPVVAWTRPMGGALQLGQATIGDVDGDGRPNTVALAGGRVVAANPDGSTLWQGPAEGARSVLGIWNLDGAGAPEVVVDTPNGAHVLAGADGHLVVALGTTAPVRAGFVALGSTGGILLLGSARAKLAAYDFRAGLQVTAPIWTASNDAQFDVAVGDVDGDGQPEVVHPRDAGFELLDPLTGVAKYTDNPIGPPAHSYGFELANVDGQPGLEIIVLDESYAYSPPAGIYVLGVRGGALTTLWSSSVTPQVALGADYYTVHGAVADLDGDGSKEAVYSQWDGTTQSWTTQIVDAVTGAAIASLPGQLVQALADLDGDGKTEVIVRANPLADRTPPRSDVRAYGMASRTAPPAARSWTLANAHVMVRASSVYGHDGPGDSPAVDAFASAAGSEVLVGIDATQSGTDTELAVLKGDGSLASKLVLAPGETASALWWGDGLTSASSKADVLAYRTDGVALALDGALQTHASFATGSYAGWITVDGLDTTRTAIAMTTSDGKALSLDGTHLHADGTPYVMASMPGAVDTSALAVTGWPVDPITYLQGAAPTLVGYQQGESAITMVGMDTTGVEVWRTTLAAGTSIYPPGPYALDLTGDGNADLVVPLVDVHALESLAVFDGTTGALVTSTPLDTIASGGDVTTTGSLVDVNGDGVLELVVPVPTVGIVAIELAASPMRALWTGPTGATLPSYGGTVAAANLDTQGLGLVRSNGNAGAGPYMRVSLGGAVVATQSAGLTLADQDRNAVAFVSRTAGAGVYDVVSAGTSGAGLARVQRLAGDTLQPMWTMYVSGGTVGPTPPAAGVSLHDPVVVDVDGDGTEEVVLGSDDGWLYALHAADGSLLFHVDLGAPVWHVVAADVDRDPALELVASLGDGRLVVLDDAGKYTAVKDPSPDAGSEGGAPPPDGGSPAGPPCNVDAGAGDGAHHDGCACMAGTTSNDGGGATIVATTVVLATVRRKRRRGGHSPTAASRVSATSGCDRVR